MTLLNILYLPDARLRKMSTTVVEFNDKLQELIDNMFQTMYHANGVGLAAPQIGVNIRLCVVDVSEEKNHPQVFINPEITNHSVLEKYKEGCLSVPGAFETVERYKNITIKALDRHYQPFEINCEGLLAECLQHEIDHLNGKLFIDLLTPIKRDRARKSFEKYIKSNK